MKIKLIIVIASLILILLRFFLLLEINTSSVKNSASFKYHIKCPWYVLILTPSQICGGVLISENIILTAAHCLENEPTDTIKVYPGVFSRNHLPKSYAVERYKIHELYDSKNLYNDIGIIKLKANVIFSSSIYPVNLPENFPQIGEIALVSGFGLQKDGNFPTYLKTFSVTLTDYRYCIYKFGSDYDNVSQICAGNILHSIDFCSGDSGGPLYYRVGDKWVVIGIVSFTGQVCGDKTPSVYTNVYAYLSWIVLNLKLN